MGYNEFILIVNAASVIILLVMALLLCLAARFKGESSYAAMIIVVSTVPVYIYNVNFWKSSPWNPSKLLGQGIMKQNGGARRQRLSVVTPTFASVRSR